MSQKTTRASAREIRRAFGPAAVASLAEHDEALAHHAEQIRQHERALADLRESTRRANDRMWTTITQVESNHFCLRDHVDGFLVHRSFWGRLRWLFTGK